ncbi:MAG: Ribulose-phosphate 3-epimerase [Lentisphaerae bacterium ADurb.BinA184]|nr:MAG: Ribulose-phosphate 3-epimerase [Lentisphaerae bacterium ADurb.BinA184]
MNRRPLTALSCRDILVAPSILAADFAHLAADIRRVETAGADILHVDVMDGHFVPNLTLGPPVVAMIRGCSPLPFDVHLMLTNPERFVGPFAEAGADHISIHVEIEADVAAVLGRIRGHGCSAGLVVRPATPAAAVAPFLHLADLVLVMTVEPGFGGQAFMAEMLPKIRAIRAMIDAGGRAVHLEVDGGINATTARDGIAAGANVLVAGTSVFRSADGARKAIRQLRQAGRED